MGALLAGVGFVGLSGAAGENLLKHALGSGDVAFGLGFSIGAVVLGLGVAPIAKALSKDDGIGDARAVQIGLYNFSNHLGVLGVLVPALVTAALVKTGLIPAALDTDADGTVPRILPVRFWKWLLLTVGGCFLVSITFAILYAWLTGTPVGK